MVPPAMKNEKLCLAFLYGILLLFFLIVSFLSEGTAGGGDDISHYFIARGAYKYPYLFLDLWGKPVFTFFTAPFAQLGIHGMQAFNIITGLLTSYFIFRTARFLDYPNAWIIILFTCLAPMYMNMMNTGMTEILFSFFLVIAAFLSLNEKYVAAALVISFLPFVRNEGLIIIPVYLVAFSLYRKWKALPFLFAGIIFYSILGYFYHKDILWIIHKWPYGNTSVIYGTGDIFFYIRMSYRILGVPLIVLFLTGLLVYLYRLIKDWSWKPSSQLTGFLLILGPLFVYVAGHSYAFWKGTVGSGGLIRFMAAVIPLVALYCLIGFNFIDQYLLKMKWIKIVVYTILFLSIVYIPFNYYKFPYRLNSEQVVVKEASQWLKENALDKGKIYYVDPHIPFFLKADYYNRSLTQQFLPDPENPDKQIPSGSFIAWDAHYMANEGGVKLENLSENESFQLITKFKPEKDFKTLGGYSYAVYIFRKN